MAKTIADPNRGAAMTTRYLWFLLLTLFVACAGGGRKEESIHAEENRVIDLLDALDQSRVLRRPGSGSESFFPYQRPVAEWGFEGLSTGWHIQVHRGLVTGGVVAEESFTGRHSFCLRSSGEAADAEIRIHIPLEPATR
jgi:hypothetical protein